MNFIDNIDFKACCNRAKFYTFNNLTHIINAGMRCSVHLNHIDIAALSDRNTRITYPARFKRNGTIIIFCAIDCLCNNACGRCFARTSLASHNKGMCQTPKLNGIAQSAHQNLLTNKTVKAGRAVFSCQNLIRRHSIGRLCNLMIVIKKRIIVHALSQT